MANKKLEAGDLKVGVKYGCLTIVGDLDTYREDEFLKKIEEKKLEKQQFIDGVWDQYHNGNINDVSFFDEMIERYSKEANTYYYRCKCQCGKELDITPYQFVFKRHRFCDEIKSIPLYFKHCDMKTKQEYYVSLYENGCGLRKIQLKKKLSNIVPIKDQFYDTELPFEVFDTLEIFGRGNDEITYYRKTKSSINRDVADPLSYNSAQLSRKYKCKCRLCGKELQFYYTDFEIHNDDYGSRATDGYYAEAKCDCHPISSFQWRTIKLFQEYNATYMAEVSFPELVGVGNTNLLRYDFAVYDENENIKALLECQGEQHYKKTKKYGSSYDVQIKNDELKRTYASEHNITLIEIPYTINTYAKEEAFLKERKILNEKKPKTQSRGKWHRVISSEKKR